MVRHELSLSVRYVSNWGVWEAVREILQNAIDQGDMILDQQPWGLRIGNRHAHLPISSLLLGETTKSTDEAAIGQFGEGYKLALLVLTRLGYKVLVRNNEEVWQPSIRFSEAYQTEVLCVDRYPASEPYGGVCFELEGIKEIDYCLKYCPEMKLNAADVSESLLHGSGQIFVKGLFVAKCEGFLYNYNFSPDRLNLDRDRCLISDFDLSWETSRLWTESGDFTRIAQMIEKKSSDVAHLKHHASTTFASGYGSYWVRKNPGAIPVSEQDEIQACSETGKKWVLVAQDVKEILRKTIAFIIPSFGKPKDKLEKWFKVNSCFLSETARAEFELIFKEIE